MVESASHVREQVPGLVPSHGITIDVPPCTSDANRPPLLHHMSTPAYESPLRHHTRTASTPRRVKETLNARSEYTSSFDDGPAQHRLNQYIIKQEIGRGSFGAVHLGVDQYGTEYAVKEFSKSRLRKRAQSHVLRGPRNPRRRGHLAAGMGYNSPLHQHSSRTDPEDSEGGSLYLIREEIAIMKKLNHPNLVSLIEVLDDPEEDSLYMVMEMCKKGVIMRVGLDERADPYGNEHCRMWFRDLILGIEYLHAQGIVHRDIKPDNCLITDDDVLKVVDFGVSEMFEKDSEMLTVKSAGSPAFLPPELCIAKHGEIAGKAADIWSMGVTLYCLRYGRIPFEKAGIVELYKSIREDPIQVDEERDDDFRDLILRILEKDPAKRITMAELREHPWVTKRGIDPLLSAEENTAELVEPPTEEEMNHAITGNMGNLLVVMKAARKFKRLIAKKRPAIMESILGGDDSPFVQPPLQIGRQLDPRQRTPNPYHLSHKSHSVETFDRRPLEKILVSEGIHRDVDPDASKLPFYPLRNMDPSLSTGSRTSGTVSKDNSFGTPRKDYSYGSSNKELEQASRGMTASPPPLTQDDAVLSPSPMSVHYWEQDGNRGHAHDPLEDVLYLRIGPSSMDTASDTGDGDDFSEMNMVVSESPGATEGNIFEIAYQEEIRKIQSRSSSTGSQPTVYLTRRVEGKKLFGDVSKMVSGVMAARHAQSTGSGAKIADLIAKAQEQDNSEKSEDKSTGQLADKEENQEKRLGNNDSEVEEAGDSATVGNPAIEADRGRDVAESAVFANEPSSQSTISDEKINSQSLRSRQQDLAQWHDEADPGKETDTPVAATPRPPPNDLATRTDSPDATVPESSDTTSASTPRAKFRNVRSLSRGGIKDLFGKMKGKVK